MKTSELITRISGKVSRAGLKVQKHSPEILIVVGVVGTVASAVMACRATLKVKDIMDETADTIETIHEAEQREDLKERYTEEDSKKDLAVTYIQTGLKFAKLYAPSVIVGMASISCMVASNKILKKRNIALAAAYETVNRSFKKYRSRVVERFGNGVDKELRYGIKAKTFTETVTDDDGNEKTEEKTVSVVENPNELSDYVKVFDESSTAWTPDSEYNMRFLKLQMNYFNEKLKAQGYLFLNDVYEQLGFKPTKAGQIVGWIYDEEHPVGDNYVDFGIYDIQRETVRDFINGYEPSILLEFNVDGNILDYI